MDQTLAELRDRLDLTQSEFAERIGMPFRTYQDLEAGKAKLRPIHVRAANYAALEVAIERGDPSLAPDDIARAAKKFAGLGKRKA